MTTTTLERPGAKRVGSSATGRKVRAICAVCGGEFDHTKKSGRPPVTCSPTCRRKRRAEDSERHRERAENPVEDEYPVEVPQPLPEAELRALRERREAYREMEMRRVGASPLYDLGEAWPVDVSSGSGELAPTTLGDLAPPDQSPYPDVEAESGTGTTVPTVRGEPAGIFASAGHGYVIDDEPTTDKDPLRLIAKKDRKHVKAEYQRLRVPVVGLYTGHTRNTKTHGHLLVKGRLTREEWDGNTVPPRIARRFCSENALTPLVPFAMTLSAPTT